ncbi:WRKY transcription factor [Trifolium repens]|nr:WRKY transcription factor [Trifolium repens]
MAGIDENLALNGDWGLPSPSPRALFSRMLEEENNVIRPNSEHPGNGRTEAQDGDSGTKLSDMSYPTEQKSSSRGGLVERIAARTGFNAPRLNTESIRSTELSLNSEIQSPYLTIPPGLSPTTLLDSPVFLVNSLAQPSPTTGKFPFVSNGNIRCSELSSDVQEKSKQNGFNDIYASSFAFKPTTDSGPSFYHGAGRNINPTTLSQQSLHGVEASVQSQRVDQVKVQTENKSSLHLKAEFSNSPPQKDNSPPMEEHADEEGEQRVNVDSLVAGVGGTPSEDGYNWRKYGQKQVKGSEYPRSYYKCTHSNCPVKKKVERSHEGHITEIIYKGAHNHPKPPPSRRAGIGSTNPHADMQVDNPEDGEPQGGGDGDRGWANLQKGNIAGAGNWKHDNLEAASSLNPEYGNQSTNLQTQNGTAHFDSGDGVDGSSTFSNEGEDDQATNGSVSLGYDAEGDESESKRRKLESYVEMSGATRAIREPRVVVQTTSEVDILDDGYRWRKYGQKVVKGNPNPRSYYKCTNAGCTVRKHVERASHDLKSVITTYEGKHNHDVPAARSSSHVNANASNAAQGQASGLLQNHVHRTEPSQIHNGMGRPSFGSFNLPGRQQLGHPHGFSFGMNQHLSNLAMSGLGSSSQAKFPVMPMNPFMAQQQRPTNEMGFMLPKGEPNVDANPERSGLNMRNGSSSMYQDIMNHMPLGPHM